MKPDLATRKRRAVPAAVLLLAWLACSGALLRQFSISGPADARAQCEANGGSWAAAFPGHPAGEAACMSPSERAGCFRPWSLGGPAKDAICGAAVPPR